MSVYTRFYMGMMSGEIPIDSTEYDDFREDVYDECRGVDEYDFNDEEYDDDEDEEADKDEADEVSDADSEKLPPLGEAVNPNMVNMLWSEECETDIVDVMAMGDRNVILFIKNDEGERDEYVRAGMLECEGTYYALLAPVIEGKICKDNLVAFCIEDGGAHRNHVLKREKDATLCKRVADEYRKLLVRYGNKKQR
ncbi:MAG: hypothetical protein LUD47_01045 [Clostridia bacterium]|nr:hypothetical protein [Clostridia bacterium]